jgi:hypothetical protein
MPKDICSLQIRAQSTIYGYKTLDLHNILGHDCYCSPLRDEITVDEKTRTAGRNPVWLLL